MPVRPSAEVVRIQRAAELYLHDARLSGLNPPTRPMDLYQAVERQAGITYRGTPLQRQAARDEFNDRARRVLHKLADAGLLVRSGSGRNLEFLTPEEARRRRAQSSAREQELAAWQGVKRRLHGLGLIETGKDGEVEMPLPVWEQLLNLAEKGEACLMSLDHRTLT